MKKIASVLVLLSILSWSNAAKAHELDFSGFRPDFRNTYPEGFSFAIPIVPYVGVRDVGQFGNIDSFVKVFKGVKFRDYGNLFSNIVGMLNSVNTLYKNDLNLDAMVLSRFRFSFVSKYIDILMRGGVVNYSTGRIYGLTEKLTVWQLRWDSAGLPGLSTNGQKVFEGTSSTLMGAELWMVGKIPVKRNILLLFGAGAEVGYFVTSNYTSGLSENFTVYTPFDQEETKTHGLLGNLNLLTGVDAQLRRFTLRGILVLNSLASQYPMERVTADLHASINFPGILSLSTSLYDLSNPEWRVELSKRFHTNCEAAAGAIVNSHRFNGHLGYLSIMVGGKVAKVTGTLLFQDKRVGILVGATVGYFP